MWVIINPLPILFYLDTSCHHLCQPSIWNPKDNNAWNSRVLWKYSFYLCSYQPCKHISECKLIRGVFFYFTVYHRQVEVLDATHWSIIQKDASSYQVCSPENIYLLNYTLSIISLHFEEKIMCNFQLIKAWYTWHSCEMSKQTKPNPPALICFVWLVAISWTTHTLNMNHWSLFSNHSKLKHRHEKELGV